MTQSLWGLLTLISYVAVFVFAAGAFVLVTRLLKRQDSPLSEQVGGLTAILRKVRKRETTSRC